MDRRQFVTGSSCIPALALSGCVSKLFASDRQVLSCLELANLHDEPHTVHLRVVFDGDEVLSDSRRLAAKPESGSVPGETVDRTWPDRPGRFRVRARIGDEPEWKTFDSEGRPEGLAYRILYRIDGDGYGAFWRNTTDVDDQRSQCGDAAIADDDTPTT